MCNWVIYLFIFPSNIYWMPKICQQLFLMIVIHPWKKELLTQPVKCLSAMQETRVQSLGREDPLEKAMAIHSSTIAWRIPWTEEPGRLQSMGSQRVGHNWVTSLSFPFGWSGRGSGPSSAGLRRSSLEKGVVTGVWQHRDFLFKDETSAAPSLCALDSHACVVGDIQAGVSQRSA